MDFDIKTCPSNCIFLVPVVHDLCFRITSNETLTYFFQNQLSIQEIFEMVKGKCLLYRPKLIPSDRVLDNWTTECEKIPRIFMDPEYNIHNSLPSLLIISHMNPVHAIPHFIYLFIC
jgi:hypothetical protein